MLTTYELFLYSAVILLLPLAIAHLLAGSPPPELSRFARYYHAEKYLGLAGDVFLLTICADAIVRLAMHYDFLARDFSPGYVGVPFMVTLLAYLVLWLRAVMKVRRQRDSAGS